MRSSTRTSTDGFERSPDFYSAQFQMQNIRDRGVQSREPRVRGSKPEMTRSFLPIIAKTAVEVRMAAYNDEAVRSTEGVLAPNCNQSRTVACSSASPRDYFTDRTWIPSHVTIVASCRAVGA